MNHVTNHSPSKYKALKRVFAISMIIATVFSYAYYCGNNFYGKQGEEVEHHDEDVQSNELIAKIVSPELYFLTQEINTYRQVYTFTASLSLSKIETIKQAEQIENEQKKRKDTKEKKTKAIKQNAMYYVNDNGYKSYLDSSYQNHLYAMCIKYNVEKYYTLFIAQMYHESTFQTNIVSKTNDYGLMQINKCNHQWLGRKLGNYDFLDPYNNIEAGIYMMSDFLHKYNDVEKALVCYNRGESAVKKGIYSTSYSKGVLEDMNLLKKLD